MKKSYIAGIFSLASLVLLAACSMNNGAVATTNAGDVTKNELYDQMKEFYGGQVLEKLILEKVLAKNHQVSDQEVAHVVNRYKQQYGTQFNTMLKQQGKNEAQFTKDIQLNLLVEKATEPKIKVTDKELESYYQTWEPKITVSHILVNTEQEAKEIQKDLAEGQDFASLAKGASIDYTTRENGGQLEPFGPGALPEVFEKAAYALKEKGDLSNPVETPYGWSIIKLDKPAVKTTFEKDKDQVKADYIADKMTLVLKKETVIEEAEKAKIKIKDETLEQTVKDLVGEQLKNY